MGIPFINWKRGRKVVIGELEDGVFHITARVKDKICIDADVLDDIAMYGCKAIELKLKDGRKHVKGIYRITIEDFDRNSILQASGISVCRCCPIQHWEKVR